MLKMNPYADKFTTKEECNRSEFCQWDDEEQKCKGLSIDYAVRKMSIMRAKLNQRFLDMMQVAAIDCLVFRELHDDRSRQCFVAGMEPSAPQIRAYRGFNEAEYEEADETVTKQTTTVHASGNKTKTMKCRRIKNEAECEANRACYVERGKFYGFKCKNKDSPYGVNHQKCPVYYDDKKMCNADPMCKWVRTGAFKRNYTCQNRYIKSLTDYKLVGDFAIGLMTNASDIKTNRHYIVYPLATKNMLRTEKDIHTVLHHFKRRCDATGASAKQRTPLVSVLEELYEMVEQDAMVVKDFEDNIREYIQKDSKQNEDEWFEYRDTVNPLMNRIMELYKVIKQLDDVKESEDTKPFYEKTENTIPADTEKAHAPVVVDNVQFEDVRKRVLLCTEKEGTHTIKTIEHDLLYLRNNGHTHFHYTFHLFFNSKHYLFESNERHGAAIVLSQMAEMKQIHKHIELLDLSIRLVFHIRHMKIKQVDMRVYLLSEGMNVDDKSQFVRTVFVDKDNVRHHMYSEHQCNMMWEKHSMLKHPMAFACKTSRDKDPRKVVVDGVRLPSKCPYTPDSGELDLPKALQEHKDTRIQANHCYRNWMHAQRHRDKTHSRRSQRDKDAHKRQHTSTYEKKRSLRARLGTVWGSRKNTDNTKT
jgi:hypothetical protein